MLNGAHLFLAAAAQTVGLSPLPDKQKIHNFYQQLWQII
jgi:hypothetical protein